MDSVQTGVGDGAVDLVEILRGDRVESVHRGHAVICDAGGEIVAAWGDPTAVIYPRSSCKMVQALPLLESGAGADLSQAHLALSCASHNGAAIHTDRVTTWLRDLGMTDADLRCGVQTPDDPDASAGLIRTDTAPCQIHNNCSGKHAGFLTLSRHLNAGPDYVEVDHPVQLAVRRAFEDVTAFDSPGFGIDGCSAPNFATRLDALGRAMGAFAGARDGHGTRADAMVRLTQAMMAHPELVAGEGRACTGLMRAMNGAGAVKTGAEAVFVAILPGLGRGIALKIVDGSTRAAEAVISALLVRLGALSSQAPVARALTHGPILNRRGLETGHMRVLLD